jgi:hypothetical protein
MLDCREYFTKALEAYGDRSIYNPESTRAYFNRCKSLQRLGQDADAKADEETTLELYRKLVPNESKTLAELTDKDLDKIIVFWSR